jgi:hypothetical protein
MPLKSTTVSNKTSRETCFLNKVLCLEEKNMDTYVSFGGGVVAKRKKEGGVNLCVLFVCMFV